MGALRDAAVRSPEGERTHGKPEGAGRRILRLEVYGPADTALMVDALGDRREQLSSRLRPLLAGFGARLGAPGSVSYLFNEVGMLLFEPGTNVQQLTCEALRAGAEEVVANPDGSVEVLTDPLELAEVCATLAGRQLAPALALVTYRASTAVRLSGAAAESMLRLLAALDDLHEIQNVYTNAEILDEVLARI